MSSKDKNIVQNGERVCSQTRATRQDVARLAGVSETSVSFVYSKKRYVSPEITERVLEAAKRLNYYPDMIAASMVRGRTNSIAVLTEDIVSPVQMQIVQAIQARAFDAGYFVYVLGGVKRLDKYLNSIISRKVDGLFLSVSPIAIDNDMLTEVLNRGTSVIVTSSRGFIDDRVCGIELDFELGMRDILDHLRDLGHSKIAYLSYCDETVGDKRLPVFKEYMRETFGVNDAVVEMGDPPYSSDIEQGKVLCRRLLSWAVDFTALVCANDLMAYGAMLVLSEHGINVPRDVSVVGIDDISFSQATYPPLTTLSHCCDDYGSRICEILLDNISDKSKVRREVVRPKLIVRESTAQNKASSGAE